MVERKYNLYMDGEIIDRNLSKADADALLEEYAAADDEDDEEHYYMIKPVQ